MYEQGIEIKVNDKKSVKLFELCAESGMVDSEIRLADKLYRGEGVKKDVVRAKRLLEDGINNNKIMAYRLLGNINADEGNLSGAISCYLKAEKIFKTDKQDVDEYVMAIIYESLADIFLCKDKNVYNPLKAIEYTDKALKEDVFCTAKDIGDLYYYGTEVNKDLKKAEFYYKRIADEEQCNQCRDDCNNYCRNQLYRIWIENKVNGI